MIEGLGGLTDGAPSCNSYFDNDHTGADKWETALVKAGAGNYDSMISNLYYWSSSESSTYNAVYLLVDASGAGTDYGFFWSGGNKGLTYTGYRVRPVLAF